MLRAGVSVYTDADAVNFRFRNPQDPHPYQTRADLVESL